MAASNNLTEIEWAMQQALNEARLAACSGEVPVGAVLLDAGGQIIGRGHNRVIGDHDPTAHAEIMALRQAAKRQQNYRLPDTTLVVTLEPCLMCMGALFNARVSRVFYGASDPKTGVCESVLAVQNEAALNHHTVVQGGVCAQDCAALLREFFAQRRRKPSASTKA